MLFIVPDDSPAEGASGKTPSVKVELDIEDAPFLQEPEEPKPPAKEPEKPAPAETAPPPAKGPSAFKLKLAALLANKKRLALIGGGLLILLIAPIAISMFLHRTPAPPPQEPVRKIVPDEPPRENTPAGPKFLFKGEPFLIERRGGEGEIRFLRCRFSIPTDNPSLYAELQAKNIAVRDAIYYYLHTKPVTFLSDSAQSEVLKKDLISVINEHLSADKIQELYIEEYLVTRL